MRCRSQGSVLLTTLGILMVMAMLAALLLQQLQLSSELTHYALRYHHAHNALQGYLLEFQMVVEDNQDLCQAQQIIPQEKMWHRYPIQIDCTRKGADYFVKGILKEESQAFVPIELEQTRTFKLRN